MPFVTQFLAPFSTQWSPSRTAVASSAPASEPAAGSDSENAPSSWLTGRVGCQQARRMEKAGDNLDVNSADFLYGLGVGVHFNNFDVDATLNQNFPFTGGYFISGESTSGTMFGRITADYHF